MLRCTRGFLGIVAWLLFAPSVAGAQLDPPITEFEFITLECSDGLDNDFDGRFDYPEDPDCVDAQDEAERTPTRTRGARARFRPVREPRDAEHTRVADVSRYGEVMVGSIAAQVPFPGFLDFVEVGSVVWKRGRPRLIEDLRPFVTEGFQGYSAATAVSDDGHIVAGWRASDDDPGPRRAYLWRDGVFTDLESPPHPLSDSVPTAAAAVSNTGVAVGLWFNQPARWDERGITILEPGLADTNQAWARAITPDAAFTVGRSRIQFPAGPLLPLGATHEVATLWMGDDPRGIPLAPLDEIEFLPGDGSWAFDVSDDGHVIVGQVNVLFPFPGRTFAFRWRDGEVEYFGLEEPDDSHFPNAALYDIAGDGSLAVGHAVGFGPVVLDGARLRSLVDLLENEYGVDLRGWDLAYDFASTSISADGRTVVASGFRPDGSVAPYSVRLPPACADGLDNDGDGAIDHPEDPGCRSRFHRSEQKRWRSR